MIELKDAMRWVHDVLVPIVCAALSNALATHPRTTHSLIVNTSRRFHMRLTERIGTQTHTRTRARARTRARVVPSGRYESRVAGAPEATIIGANFLLGGIRLRQALQH